MRDAPQKLCRTCDHCYMDGNREPYTGHVSYMYRCAVKLYDPVSGKLGDPECTLARLNEALCGWGARYWKERSANRPEIST